MRCIAVASVLHSEHKGVVIEGYLFAVNVLHGALSDVPYSPALVFFGTRFDPALGYAVTFTGNALPLRYIPVGTTVHNVELKPGGGGKLARG